MRNHVRFRSLAFGPQDLLPGQIDEERFGYVLATWVAARLEERGVSVDVPTPERWGWTLGATHDRHGVRLVCGNMDGSTSEWMVWIEPDHRSFLARILGRRSSPRTIAVLAKMLDGALRANPSVGEIEWFRVGSRGEELDHATTPA